jgi:hypothetical protein
VMDHGSDINLSSIYHKCQNIQRHRIYIFTIKEKVYFSKVDDYSRFTVAGPGFPYK